MKKAILLAAGLCASTVMGSDQNQSWIKYSGRDYSSSIQAIAGAPSEITGSLDQAIVDDFNQFGLNVKVAIFFNPRIAQLVAPRAPSKNESDFYWRTVLTTKLSSSSDEVYRIEYSPGPSIDPSFRVCPEKVKNCGSVPVINGTTIIVPGTDYLYTAGFINDVFDRRRKFKLKKGHLVEVKQPFYYVGFNTTLSEEIKIYSDKQFKEEVAALPAESAVTVELADGDDFLLRTPFGLTGWYRPKKEIDSVGGPAVRGLGYHGD